VLATSSKGRSAGSVVAAVASILLLVIAGLVFLNRQYVTDQITVWSYEPSQAVQTINTRVGFSDKGSFYFYANRPDVAEASQFNQGCPRQEPSSPILGCYTGSRIFIYDITNEKLNGIEEVTAAHEMLHGAWDRLNNEERTRLTTLLRDEYTKHASGDLAERIAYYERNEPGQVVNELHSILPTEVKDLSPELEKYYAQYFEDRQKVVALHDQYSSVLKDLNTQAQALFDELTSLSATIESAKRSYDSGAAALAETVAAFNARSQNGGFSSQQQFNSERAALLAQSNTIDASRDAINSDIDRYNEAYQQYQNVAGELDTLNKSLDSISNLPQTPKIEE
jgi:uncharacterized coiled-coil DUF342 family protein